MASYIAIVRPVRSYSTNNTVEVDSLHRIAYMDYVDDRSKINGLFKLLAKDFEKLEKKLDMPKGTINNDIRTCYAMSMRARFAMGDLIIIHNADELTFESLENILNSMTPERREEFIEGAKLRMV
jgi:hypothetical protein